MFTVLDIVTTGGPWLIVAGILSSGVETGEIPSDHIKIHYCILFFSIQQFRVLPIVTSYQREKPNIYSEASVTGCILT